MNKWYLAKLVFRVLCGNGNHRPQYDEQWRLLLAEDGEAALAKANLFGREGTMPDETEQLPVQWKFLTVAGLIPLCELADGAEVLATSREPYDERAYLHELEKQQKMVAVTFSSISL